MSYFQEKEFESPDAPGSGSKMISYMVQRLERARGVAGLPFKINSGYRTEAHNKKIKGSPTSSHLGGWAVDIHCNNSKDRLYILTGLIDAGFLRIGIAKTFIHADIDPNKSPAIWLY